jgi:monothiol glutaredoxin
VTDVAPEASAADPIRGFIAQAVEQNPVVLFMKGTPDAPRCGFSSLVVQVLDHLGVDFVGVDVLQDEALRQGVKEFSDWPTIPQLYVKGEFVGGCDIVKEMFQAGELAQLMSEKGVLGSAAEA